MHNIIVEMFTNIVLRRLRGTYIGVKRIIMITITGRGKTNLATRHTVK